MYLGVQLVPIVFVDNKTDRIIKNIIFYYDGLNLELKIKKIKPKERKLLSLYNRGIFGKKTLYMKYTNEDGIDINYEIFDQLTEQYCKNMLVEINSLTDDGGLNFRVILDFIYDS